MVEAIQGLVAAYRGVSAWHPLAVLCGAGRCNTLVGGRPLIFDGDHVSPYGNVVLLPSFRHAIDGLNGPQ